MSKYKIEVQELLSRSIAVEAKSIYEAIDKVNQMYNDEKIVLDYNDLSKIKIIPTNLINEKDNLIKEVLEYLYDEEKRHFEESDNPKNHIFNKLERLKQLVY